MRTLRLFYRENKVLIELLLPSIVMLFGIVFLIIAIRYGSNIDEVATSLVKKIILWILRGL